MKKMILFLLLFQFIFIGCWNPWIPFAPKEPYNACHAKQETIDKLVYLFDHDYDNIAVFEFRIMCKKQTDKVRVEWRIVTLENWRAISEYGWRAGIATQWFGRDNLNFNNKMEAMKFIDEAKDWEESRREFVCFD